MEADREIADGIGPMGWEGKLSATRLDDERFASPSSTELARAACTLQRCSGGVKLPDRLCAESRPEEAPYAGPI